MITVPYRVALMITLNKIHPVTAWRYYYGISRQVLAGYMDMPETDIAALEKSNKHLMQENLNKLCQVFGIVPEALNIRYSTYN